MTQVPEEPAYMKATERTRWKSVLETTDFQGFLPVCPRAKSSFPSHTYENIKRSMLVFCLGSNKTLPCYVMGEQGQRYAINILQAYLHILTHFCHKVTSAMRLITVHGTYKQVTDTSYSNNRVFLTCIKYWNTPRNMLFSHIALQLRLEWNWSTLQTAKHAVEQKRLASHLASEGRRALTLTIIQY